MSNYAPGIGGPRTAAAVDRTRRLALAVGQRLPSVPGGSTTVIRPARRLAFWTAIALPFIMIGLLAQGLTTSADTTAFVSLLGVELVALILGHSHRRD